MKIGDDIEVSQNGKVVAHGTLVALDLKLQEDAIAWFALIRQGDGLMNMVPIAAITDSDASDGIGLTVKLKQPAKPDPRWYRYPDGGARDSNDTVLWWYEAERRWAACRYAELDDGDLWVPCPPNPEERTP